MAQLFTSKVVGDTLIRSVPVQHGSDVCEQHIILTKAEFLECYKKWVLPFVDSLPSTGATGSATWEFQEK